MFRDDKTTQMAAQFLKMAGGSMNYTILAKMLYVADRDMLLEWGTPITFGAWFNLDKGPIISEPTDLLRGKSDAFSECWSSSIEKVGYAAKLKRDPGHGALSPAEEKIISATFDKMRHMTLAEVLDYVHAFPEYVNPNGRRLPLEYKDVLLAYGKQDDYEQVSDMLDTEKGLSLIGRGCR